MGPSHRCPDHHLHPSRGLGLGLGLIGPSVSRAPTGTFSFGFTGSQTGRAVSVTFRRLTKADSGVYRCGLYGRDSYQHIEVIVVDGEFLIKRRYSLVFTTSSQVVIRRWQIISTAPCWGSEVTSQVRCFELPTGCVTRNAPWETRSHRSNVAALFINHDSDLYTTLFISHRVCFSAVLLVVATVLCHFYLQTC